MTLQQRIKNMIITNLMLDVSEEEFADDASLIGPAGMGLDSVDALQLVVEIEKNFGLKITDPDVARRVLQSVNTIAAAVEEHAAAK
ncbi:MAG: phosphopantetheine-binding protein [Prosthecobacter sp.]